VKQLNILQVYACNINNYSL